MTIHTAQEEQNQGIDPPETGKGASVSEGQDELFSIDSDAQQFRKRLVLLYTDMGIQALVTATFLEKNLISSVDGQTHYNAEEEVRNKLDKAWRLFDTDPKAAVRMLSDAGEKHEQASRLYFEPPIRKYIEVLANLTETEIQEIINILGDQSSEIIAAFKDFSSTMREFRVIRGGNCHYSSTMDAFAVFARQLIDTDPSLFEAIYEKAREIDRREIEE